MQIYINKNGQQLGPFEESRVLEMLRNGQLLPTDLGFKQGQQQWLKLEIMFPQPKQTPVVPSFQFNNQFNNQPQPQPQKSSGLKVLLFALLGIGGLFLVGIIGIVALLFLKTPNKPVTNISLSNTGNNTTANVNLPTNSNTNTRVANTKELDDKLKELAQLKPPAKIEPKPTLRGKILVVEQLDREADSTLKFLPSYSLSNYGLKSEQLAVNLAELETIIQIKCGKGKEVGKYGPRMAYYSAFSNICNISIIDYKASKTIAQKSFVNANHPKTIPNTGYDFINDPPTEEVEKYIKGISVE